MQVKLKDVCVTAGTQIRVTMSQDKIAEYAEMLQEGVEFGPVNLIDDGTNLYLWDGFHRYFAHEKLGRDTIEANVERGTLRDAVLRALGANSKHGLPRTLADRRNAVSKMLDDVEWGSWSHRSIAEACDVSHGLVQRMRAERQKAGAPAPVEPKAPKQPAVPEPVIEANLEAEEFDEREEALKDLAHQVEELRGKLAMSVLPEEQREEAKTYLDELKEENARLRQQLDAVTLSRDQFMAENAQLKKQVAMLQRKLKT